MNSPNIDDITFNEFKEAFEKLEESKVLEIINELRDYIKNINLKTSKIFDMEDPQGPYRLKNNNDFNNAKKYIDNFLEDKMVTKFNEIINSIEHDEIRVPETFANQFINKIYENITENHIKYSIPMATVMLEDGFRTIFPLFFDSDNEE